MRIKIGVGFAALVCLIGWMNGYVCASFLLGVLVHEAAHYAALRFFGVAVNQICFGVGGAVMETNALSYRQEILCAAAGPLASLLLGMLLLKVSSLAALISLGLAAVNLLPLYPLDGGRILSAVLMLFLPQKQAGSILHIVTTIVCMLLMVAACWATISLQAGVWPIFAALILLWRIGGMEKQLLFSDEADRMKEQEK